MKILPLASRRGKKKTHALQLTKGMTEEKKKKNARAADARAFHRGIALV